MKYSGLTQAGKEMRRIPGLHASLHITVQEGSYKTNTTVMQLDSKPSAASHTQACESRRSCRATLVSLQPAHYYFDFGSVQ